MDALFDMDHTPVPAPETLSPDRRRTLRQQAVIDAGGHPLNSVWPTRRHPDTKGQTYTREDPKRRPLTCGTCIHRVIIGYHTASYPKCVEGENAPRDTHGAASDVRAWWPACDRYQA